MTDRHTETEQNEQFISVYIYLPTKGNRLFICSVQSLKAVTVSAALQEVVMTQSFTLLHCLCLFASESRVSLMVFIEGDIWTSQLQWDWNRSEWDWRRRATAQLKWESEVKERERRKRVSHIFIQVGLLQVDDLKLDSLQNLLHGLTRFVVQLFTWCNTHTNLVNNLETEPSYICERLPFRSKHSFRCVRSFSSYNNKQKQCHYK